MICVLGYLRLHISFPSIMYTGKQNEKSQNEQVIQLSISTIDGTKSETEINQDPFVSHPSQNAVTPGL